MRDVARHCIAPQQILVKNTSLVKLHRKSTCIDSFIGNPRNRTELRWIKPAQHKIHFYMCCYRYKTVIILQPKHHIFAYCHVIKAYERRRCKTPLLLNTSIAKQWLHAPCTCVYGRRVFGYQRVRAVNGERKISQCPSKPQPSTLLLEN